MLHDVSFQIEKHRSSALPPDRQGGLRPYWEQVRLREPQTSAMDVERSLTEWLERLAHHAALSLCGGRVTGRQAGRGWPTSSEASGSRPRRRAWMISTVRWSICRTAGRLGKSCCGTVLRAIGGRATGTTGANKKSPAAGKATGLRSAYRRCDCSIKLRWSRLLGALENSSLPFDTVDLLTSKQGKFPK